MIITRTLKLFVCLSLHKDDWVINKGAPCVRHLFRPIYRLGGEKGEKREYCVTMAMLRNTSFP